LVLLATAVLADLGGRTLGGGGHWAPAFSAPAPCSAAYRRLRTMLW
jgi:hypothetical protein